MNMRRFSTLTLITSVVGGWIALPMPGFAQQPPTPQSMPANPTPAPVVIPGSIEAFEMSDQFGKVSGYISDVKADIGDHVQKGQVLATIDDPELEKELAAAKAALEAKRQMLQASDAAMQQAQTAVEVAKQQMASLGAEQRLADVTLKRQQELFASKAITDQQLDDVRAKSEIASANAAVAGAKIAASEADLKAAQANRGVAAAQVEVALAEVEKTSTMLQYTRIVAPFDGVITRRLANRGDLVQAGGASRMPLFTCQRIDVVRVFGEVPETAAANIRAGNPAEVKIYGLGGEVMRGTITRVGTAIDPQSRTMRAEIDLPNPRERLRPGMYVQVTLTPEGERVVANPP
jgi:multidrug efflux pump subunit AcrA (membrane-fusion protein)